MRFSDRLLEKTYIKEYMDASLMKFYCWYGEQYVIPLSRLLQDSMVHDHIQWHPKLVGHNIITFNFAKLDIVSELALLTKGPRFYLCT